MERLNSKLTNYQLSDFEYLLSIEYEARGRGLTKYDIKAFHVLFISGAGEWYLHGFCFDLQKPQLFKLSSIRKIYDRNHKIDKSERIESYLLNLGDN